MTVLLVQGNAPVAQNGGFTIEALTIKFARVNEVVQRNGNGNSAINPGESISAFGLQESEAQITLSNPTTGQAVQVQVPPAVMPTATTTPAALKALPHR